MWRVTEASLFASTLFSTDHFFSKNKVLKLKLNFFQGFKHQKGENHPISEFGFSYVAKTMEG
jgi:hypothetical protein